MRFIIYGVGAIGGTVAGLLAKSGQEVVGIARGKRLEALQKNGLILRRPDGTSTVRFPVVGSPAEIDFRDDDAVLLVTKSQDTLEALHALRAAGMTDQPLFCCQNGVDNERMAARFFPNVHGVTVMLPAEYTEAGDAISYCMPNAGIFDIGRYPRGADAADAALAEALTPAGIVGAVDQDVMVSKYGKLLLNLGNIVEASLGAEGEGKDIRAAVVEEGRRVLEAAGIAFADVGHDNPRRALMQRAEVPGYTRLGGSSLQSLWRGAGSIETDYLNGELALLGTLHGVPTPLNRKMARLADRLVREKRPPGSMTRDELAAELGL